MLIKHLKDLTPNKIRCIVCSINKVKETIMTLLYPTLVQRKMQTTTGDEQDFWYDRYYDLCAERDNQMGEALNLMNQGSERHV